MKSIGKLRVAAWVSKINFILLNLQGLRETKWRWTITDTRNKKNRKDGKQSISSKRAYAVCTFRVTLNVVS